MNKIFNSKQNPREQLKNLAAFRMLFFLYLILVFWDHSFTKYFPQNFFAQTPSQGIFQFLPVLNSYEVFNGVNLVWKIGVVLSLIGILSPWSMLLTFVSGLYKFGYSEGFGAHVFGVQLPLLLNLLLVFTPCSEYYSFKRKKDLTVDARSSIFYLKLIITLYYFNAGLAKVIEDKSLWFVTDHLAYIINLFPYKAAITTNILEHHGNLFLPLSITVVLLELLSPLALINPFSGIIFCIGWTTLHISVTYFFGGHNFFLWQIPCYMIFINGLYYPYEFFLKKFSFQKFE